MLLAIHHPDKVKKLAITGANLWIDTLAIAADLFDLPSDIDSLYKLTQTPEVKNKIKVTKLLYQKPNITLQQLHTIKCPTLVIGGDHDVILPQHTMLIAHSIPSSYLWILPNSGHATPVFYKKQFNKTVDNFFNKPYRVIAGLARLN